MGDEGVEMVAVPRAEWDALKVQVAGLLAERRFGRGGLRDGGGVSTARIDDRTGRRTLLKRGAMLAAGAVAGGAALVATQADPASATTATMVYGTNMDSGTDRTSLTSTSFVETLLVTNSANGSAILAGDNGTGTGAALGAQLTNPLNTAASGFFLTEGTGSAVVVETFNTSNTNASLLVTTNSTASAVSGEITNASSSGAALSGITNGTGSAVAGQITNGASAAHAVSGVTNGTGAGVFGQISNATSTFPAVTGVHSGPGAALGGVATGVGPAIEGLVFGGTGQAIVCGIANAANTQPAISTSTNGTGPAIQGQAASGRGAVLAGGAAQVQLVPSAASTHPTSGQAGDLFVDKSARIWFCTVGGATATWKQFTLA